MNAPTIGNMCEPSWLLAPGAQQYLEVLRATDEWTALADGKERAKSLDAGFEACLRTISTSNNFGLEFLESQTLKVGDYLTSVQKCHTELTDLQEQLYRRQLCPPCVVQEARRTMLTLELLQKELSHCHVFYKLNFTLAKKH